MNYPLTDFFVGIVVALSPDGVFGITAALFLCGFIVALSVAVKTESSAHIVSGYYALISGAAIVIFSALVMLAGVDFSVYCFYFAFLAAESSVFSLTVNALSYRKRTFKEEKELIKYIDGEIKKEAVLSSAEQKKQECGTKKADNENDAQLDFTHVKNVIDRLSFYDIGQADKKRIEQLKDVLFSAEKNGVTAEKKEKINEGLSFLLKIMSKYGV